MKTIATVIAVSIGLTSAAAFAQSADEELQPRFKRAQIVSKQTAVNQDEAKRTTSPYSFLTENSP